MLLLPGWLVGIFLIIDKEYEKSRFESVALAKLAPV